MRFTALPIGNFRKIFPTAAQQRRVIENALDATALAIKVDYDVTTQTWTNRSRFDIRRTRWYERTISTADDKYIFVTKGTRPHVIRPRNAPALRFAWGGPGSYTAKTTPRIIASRPGGPSGPIVYRQEVHHPGTQARRFEQTISKKWRDQWPRTLARAIGSEF